MIDQAPENEHIYVYIEKMEIELLKGAWEKDRIDSHYTPIASLCIDIDF